MVGVGVLPAIAAFARQYVFDQVTEVMRRTSAVQVALSEESVGIYSALTATGRASQHEVTKRAAPVRELTRRTRVHGFLHLVHWST